MKMGVEAGFKGCKGLTLEGGGDLGKCCDHFHVLEGVTSSMEDPLEGRMWEAGGPVGAWLSPLDCRW